MDVRRSMTSAADIPLYMARNQENLGIVPELAATRELGEIRRTIVSVPGIAEALTGGVREAWLVTRYETVRAVLADHVRFSSDVGRYAERVSLPPGVSGTDMAAL
jgi:cytochrome P450